MTDALYYAIIRFRPMSATGEFANIGVAVFDPDEKAIAFRLAPKRFRRVTQFFDNINAEVYSNTIHLLVQELGRLQSRCLQADRSSAVAYFTSFVKQREGIVTFSKIHGVVSNEVEKTASDLYNRFVRRTSEAVPQREFELTKGIRKALRTASISSFKDRHIEDELMPVRLPFVSDTWETLVIKPVAFDQKSTIAIIDHANLWRDRFSYFIDNGRLKKSNILLAIDSSGEDERDINNVEDIILQAKSVAYDRLRTIGVQTVEYDPDFGLPDAIRDFAYRGEKHRHFLG